MNILIAGGTGFVGSKLCAQLLADDKKHYIVVLTRQPEKVTGDIVGVSDLTQINNEVSFDVVVNLTGEPIANKRWSNQQKQRIISSRVETTQKLIEYFKTSKNKPSLFISGSAIGFYGVGVSNKNITEEALGDNSFSSQLCQKWEAVALKAEALGIRTCRLRTGIVLGKGGGALQKMLPPFKLGLGGKIGHGNQWMPWIHIDDLVGIIRYCIDHEEINGAVNGTAPNPVTNIVFTKTLGNVLNRLTLMPMPAIVVKLMMGQMGEELLLSGKKVVPKKITQQGYIFKYPKLEDALLNVV